MLSVGDCQEKISARLQTLPVSHKPTSTCFMNHALASVTTSLCAMER